MSEGHEPPVVVLYIMDAGGGHRAAANALIAACAQRDPGFRLEVVTIQDVLAPVDWVRRLSGVSLEETYNDMVRRGWTVGLVPLLRGLQWTIRRIHRAIVSLMADDLAHRRPAAVVSLCPNFNAPLRDAVRAAHPGVPFVVHLTDYADFPPHFWMVPGLDAVVVGCDEAAAQARAIGLPDGRILRLSGMILHPRFYPRASPERAQAVRRDLGIEPDAFVTLLLFGGKGTPEMAPLARDILASIPNGHVVAVGGSNPKLVSRLTALGVAEPRLHAYGFTDRVADLMAASDVLVTKPGPGSVAEALHQRVPVVTIANARTVPQERFNARYLGDHGFGYVERRWRDLPARVRRLASDPGLRQAMVARQAALPDNEAVFEAVRHLAALVGAPSSESSPVAAVS